MSTQITHRSLDEPPPTPPITGTGDHHRIPPARVILATVLSILMTSLGPLVVTIVFPQIHQDPGISAIELQWSVNAYTLAYATLILLTTVLEDRIGRRKPFSWVVFLLISVSALAALASALLISIGARVVQGAGGTAIDSLPLTLLADAAPLHLRELVIGVWGSVNGLGVVAGPIVGGTVVEDLHRSFTFWVSLLVGTLSLSLGRWGFHNVVIVGRSEARSTDLAGLAMVAASVSPLARALVEGSSHDWTSPLVLGCLALTLASLAGFIWRERIVCSAFVPARLLRDRSFNLVNTVAALFSAGIFGSVSLVSQYFQIGMGSGSSESGLYAAPRTMAPMMVAPVVGVLVECYGPRAVLLIGMMLQTAIVRCFVLLAHMSNDCGLHILLCFLYTPPSPRDWRSFVC